MKTEITLNYTAPITYYQNYFFNRDIGDTARANYWLSRIQEHESLTSKN